MSDSLVPWTRTSGDFDAEWSHVGPDVMDGVPDILSTMFAKQREHMTGYAQITGGPIIVRRDDNPNYDWHSRIIAAKAREFAGYTVEELYEAIGVFKNKPWKQSPVETDVPHLLTELGDMWHFLIELHLILGLNAEDVFRMYFERARSNEQRRATEY